MFILPALHLCSSQQYNVLVAHESPIFQAWEYSIPLPHSPEPTVWERSGKRVDKSIRPDRIIWSETLIGHSEGTVCNPGMAGPKRSQPNQPAVRRDPSRAANINYGRIALGICRTGVRCFTYQTILCQGMDSSEHRSGQIETKSFMNYLDSWHIWQTPAPSSTPGRRAVSEEILVTAWSLNPLSEMLVWRKRMIRFFF